MRLKSGTQCDYERVRRNFGEWLTRKGHTPLNQEAFDKVAKEYVTWVYDERRPAYWACNLVASMELHYLTQGKWILTSAAAACFRANKPVHSWPPLPVEVTLGAAAALWAWGEKEAAMAILLGFH
jgi:hypothetical protein